MQILITHIIFSIAMGYVFYQVFHILFRKPKCSGCAAGVCSVAALKQKRRI